ncbi:hypothetical protein K7432_015333 [Basidiobolus ranarum]|uniref:Uncharacterized protein n=1 Tax=Basidiobolus ranarum TaxID=34480 RepID=A0ABR2WG81_9FUNG
MEDIQNSTVRYPEPFGASDASVDLTTVEKIMDKMVDQGFFNSSILYQFYFFTVDYLAKKNPNMRTYNVEFE